LAVGVVPRGVAAGDAEGLVVVEPDASHPPPTVTGVVEVRGVGDEESIIVEILLDVLREQHACCLYDIEAA